MGKAEDERAKRLAEALRANLRRRKVQARGEGGTIPKADEDLPVSEP